MKKSIIALAWLLLTIFAHGQTMDTDGIKKLVQNMDDSLPRGKTFHINYSYVTKNTDFYYEQSRALIRYMTDYRAKAKKDPVLAAKLSPEENFNGFIDMLQRKLKDGPESNCLTDYSLSDQGFYMKRQYWWPNNWPGKLSGSGPSIYVSDGKIMGSFYDNAQAAIQPATERPGVAGEDWWVLAYRFGTLNLGQIIQKVPMLNLTREGNDLKITGERPGLGTDWSQYELRIDSQTLLPKEITQVYYDDNGKLYNKLIKRWQFQDFSGIVLPKVVVEEDYERDLENQLHLATTQTLTINSYSPVPVDSKAELAALLKGNYSIYDEITGSHYLSGDAGQMLDNLSK